jgi:hypothetical protein
VYEPSDHDFVSRSVFCEQFVTLVNEDPDVIYCLIMSGEAHFELSGCMYKQNMPF